MWVGAIADNFSSGDIELVAQGRLLSGSLRFVRSKGKRTGQTTEFKAVPVRKSLGPTEHELLALGSVVGDRYRIIGISGQGGMGIVYKARDLVVPRTVALKMLREDCCTDEQVLRRFQKEAKAASLLNHPHIVAIHDFGMPSASQAFLAMDFHEGTNLQRVILEEGCISLGRFKNIFLPACDALEHAHQNGVVHRDVKPSNLLLVSRQDNPEFVIIVDFGLVKLMSLFDDQRVTTTNTLVGSPLYMSPEQCKRMAVDHRSDIYALGCTMYEALAGRPPLQGETPLETFCKHIAEPPLAPSQVNASIEIPPQLDHAILKALSKDPQQRQQSMSELKEDIEKAFQRHDAVSVSLRAVKTAVNSTENIPALLTRSQQVLKLKKGLSLTSWFLFAFPIALVTTAMIVAISLQSMMDDRSQNQPVIAPHEVPITSTISAPVSTQKPSMATEPPAKHAVRSAAPTKSASSAKTHTRRPVRWTYYTWHRQYVVTRH